MSDLPSARTKNPKASLSLVLGLLTLGVIPFLTLLVAPCGFPVALFTGIAAIVTGNRARKEISANGEGGENLAKGGVVTGWIGLGINTLAMLLKLGMFIVLILLPLLTILHISRTR